MEDNSRLPYNQLYDYRMIKPIRQLKNLTLNRFSEYMKVDPATISRLENNQLEFTMHYESKFKDALKQLKVTNTEIASIRQLIMFRENRRNLN